jgi:hypothetical protein
MIRVQVSVLVPATVDVLDLLFRSNNSSSDGHSNFDVSDET